MMSTVAALMREAAETAILPRYRRLAADEVREKAPGDLVTVADADAERILQAALTGLVPGSVVVGEESVAADPALLDRVGDPGPVWLVDPLDGTANFAAGDGPFAVMVALLRDGTTRAAWILDLTADRLVTAESGAGAYLDGRRLTASTAAPPVHALRGAVSGRFLPPRLRAEILARAGVLAEVLPGHGCAGREYPDVVTGVQHFSLFWRGLPWDHAPGALIAQEAGAVVRGFDGTPYRPTDRRSGLLAAVNEAVWADVHGALIAPQR